MDNLTINRVNSPSFGAIYKPRGVLRPTKIKTAIIDRVVKRLEEINHNDGAKRSYVRIAEENGYDVLIRENKRADGIRLDLVPEDLHNEGEVFDEAVTLGSKSFIGNYKTPDEFKIDDFTKALSRNKEAEKRANGVNGGLMAAIAGLLLLMGGFGYLGVQSEGGCTRKVKTKPVPTKVVPDTIKPDTISMMREPVIKDVLKTAKKGIK